MGVRIHERFPGQWWVYVNHKNNRTAKPVGDLETAQEAKRIIEQQLGLLTFRTSQPRRNETVKTYFIQSVLGGPIKIGISSDPPRRLKTLQTSCHQKLQIIAMLDGDQEKEIHRQFSHLRTYGEWFEAVEELTQWIRTNDFTGDGKPAHRNALVNMKK